MKHRMPKHRRHLGRLIAGALAVPPVILATGLTVAATASAQPSEPHGHVAKTTSRPLYSATRVLVKFHRSVPAAAQAKLARANHAEVVGHVRDLGVTTLKVPAGAVSHVVRALERSGKVAYAEADGIAQVSDVQPNDYWWPREWSEVKVNAPQAWSMTTGSAAVTVAVLDTGVTSEPDNAGKLTAGWDFVNNDSNPTDDHGHGTMAAGVIGADSNNSIGIASFCWSCMVMPVKVMGADGTGTYSNIASGITWAADHGANVISLSLSGTADSSTLHSAVQYAHSKNVVITAAAGNSSCNCTSYPAAYPEVLGVAATDSTDALETYSNFGSWVKVAAPGSNYTTTYTGGYTSFAGTSSATPVVAGIAGLLFSAGATSNTAVETALESTAAQVGSFVKYGRIDAAAALAAITGGGAPTPPSATPSPSPSSSASPAPSPSPSPSASTSTTTFSGSFTQKSTTRQFTQTLPAGSVQASLAYTKASAMTVSLRAPDGSTVATWTGASPVALTTSSAGGGYTWVVTGPAKSSFTLTVVGPA